MTDITILRDAGLFEARAPRYTSYPPANHFGAGVGPSQVEGWLRAVPSGARVSLYVHVPYCRRLCWFCACRTQGTASDRPLAPYAARLLAELELVGRFLRPDVTVSAIHLGGGTPTILPPDLLAGLCDALRRFRPLAPDVELSVEIDPTEVDEARMATLGRAGLTRASIGVQDFDPRVQEAIGRAQGFAQTRDVVALARGAGARSLNMDVLYGLPFQTPARLSETMEQVLSLGPDRVALFGYAHVPWMAKRQVMIPSEALPGTEERHALFEAASDLLLWDGFEAVGIDHFARPGDALARAAREGAMRRNFQGYTEDDATVLIGLGASAISRYPQGYAQGLSHSSAWAEAVDAGRLPVERGHAFTPEDRLRADMIEQLMCRFAIDLAELSAAHGVPVPALQAMLAPLRRRLGPLAAEEGSAVRLVREPRLMARIAAREVDAYHQPEGRHSRAM